MKSRLSRVLSRLDILPAKGVNLFMQDELYHYGIPLQKWGVRRFQNKDRTWTAEGKIRYGRDSQKKRKAAEEDGSTNRKKKGRNLFDDGSAGAEKKYRRYMNLQGTKSIIGGDHRNDKSVQALTKYHDEIYSKRNSLKGKTKDGFKESVNKIAEKHIDEYAKGVLEDMGYNADSKSIQWLKNQPWFGMHGAQDIVFDGTAKSGIIDDYQKRQLKKEYNVDEEYLKNTKMKDIDITKLDPKHDMNKSDVKKFIATVAYDALVPGAQAYLVADAARLGQHLYGQHKTKKYEKEREANPIDKKTGFHLKTQNLSDKEDIKRVNPEVNDFNSNSKSNCVLCTMTMEMRRRGYDVTANKAGVGYFDHELTRFFKNYKMENMGSTKSIASNLGYDRKFAKSIVEKIERTQPEGSRGNLSVAWGGAMGGGGHSMFYEIKNGKMTIFDGQTGKIYSNPTKILQMCTNVDIGRLDNLQFDTKGIKECCR